MKSGYVALDPFLESGMQDKQQLVLGMLLASLKEQSKPSKIHKTNQVATWIFPCWLGLLRLPSLQDMVLLEYLIRYGFEDFKLFFMNISCKYTVHCVWRDGELGGATQ